jgi:hypothetical protein
MCPSQWYGASLDSFDDDETTAFMLPEDFVAAVSEAVRHQASNRSRKDEPTRTCISMRYTAKKTRQSLRTRLPSLDSFDDDETTAFMLPEDFVAAVSEAVRHLIASLPN